MGRRRRSPTVKVDPATEQAQAAASSPRSSAWVSANAGSGKTFVLARRVVRLLLAGSDPGRILCLTFTKAAAAEMAKRVFRELADWTAMEDGELRAAIAAIEGRRPSADEMAVARRLFARALETPGGLKIQTIHAFCERLLHQFPFEANVAGHFEVLDERDAAELKTEARKRILARADRDPVGPLGSALATVLDETSDIGHEGAIAEFIDKRDRMRRWIVSSDSLDRGLADLRTALGLAEGDTVVSRRAVVLSGCPFTGSEVGELLAALRASGPQDREAADRLAPAVESPELDARVDGYLAFFMKGGEPRSVPRLATNAIKRRFPGLEERLVAESERLPAVVDGIAAAECYETSSAMLRLADAAINEYGRLKEARGVLDFEDLIVRTVSLLSRADASRWIQYKLDRGLDHILVDEAQDTSPRQWEVIRALAEEFFAGEGAAPSLRTLFAVGDEKQSIFSFQGAVPVWFARMQRDIGGRALAAEYDWFNIALHLSFRSAPIILQAVDKVFGEAVARDGVTTESAWPAHTAHRRTDLGRVTIWPMIEPAEKPPPEDWRQPVDHLGEKSPEVRLAVRIARAVRRLLDDKELVDGADGAKPIRAGSILVLVRTRGALTDAINRELKKQGVAIAGADRLALTDHIAVKDLMALGRVMVLPDDDLSLAALLKSPLIGLGEDDLFRLAYGRPGTLWDALRKAAGHLSPAGRGRIEPDEVRVDTGEGISPYPERTVPPHPLSLGSALPRQEKEPSPHRGEGAQASLPDRPADDGDVFASAYQRLEAWRARADYLDPYAFFARVLGPDHGRRDFYRRLGAEAEDVLDEFLAQALAFEETHTPSLEGFLAWLEAAETEIKRDAELLRDEVRVMTVHGAKGLEAEVVFLVDNGTIPVHPSHDPKVLALADETEAAAPPPLLWMRSRKLMPAVVKARIAAICRKADEEYRRLLYVGMTRARDRLVVCGIKKQNSDAVRGWHALVTNALADECTPVHGAEGTIEALEWRAGERPPARYRPAQEAMTLMPRQPDWLARPVAEAVPLRRITPSTALAEGTAGRPVLIRSDVGNVAARERGRLIHRMLESLPDVAPERRREIGALYLAAVAPKGIDQAELLERVLGVLADPAFGAVFAAGSRAEVEIAGRVATRRGSAEVAGRIDRLAVTGSGVLIVDYKTNRPAPERQEEAPADYVGQLALYRALLAKLYPRKAVAAAILWTERPSLIEIPSQRLDEAFTAITAA